MSSPTESRVPRIDTNVDKGRNDFRFSLESPPSTSVSDISPFPTRTPISPSRARPTRKAKTSTNRVRNESRKLFAHVLSQLDRRPMPPMFGSFLNAENNLGDNGLGVLMETVRDTMKTRATKWDTKLHSQAGQAGEDSDDDGDRPFSTDATYDLMVQLKDVLIMSIAQGWHIFDDGTSWQKESDQEALGIPLSPFRSPSNSLQPGGRRSRSPSPAHGRQIEVPELLSLCVSVLASVVLEDCRYKIAFPRPSRPPNALQALTVDVAQFLLHTHRHDPKIVSHIGFAMIPAFWTFQPEMHTRLLTFFEEGVFRGILQDLKQIQGVNDITFIDLPEGELDGGPPINPHIVNSDIKPYPIVSIQVDAAQDIPHSELSNVKRGLWTSSSTSSLGVQSTNAPSQPLSLYYLASLAAPLLAAILECVDLEPQSNTSVAVLHRFYRLLHLIVDAKVDAYLDILQVIGYHTPKARRPAINVLLCFWPKAVGHVVISRPFPVVSYADAMDIRTHPNLLKEHPYAHQFMPWRFTPKSSGPGFRGSAHDCRSCTKPLRDFGLLCPFCMCAVHFDCYDYPEGNRLLQYALVSDENVQRVAMYRFSNVLPSRRDAEPKTIQRHNHVFKSINLFTLCLCFICREPLWGCTMQALNCISCMLFVHSTCLSNSSVSDFPPCSTTKINSDHMDIEWSELRRSCVDHHCDILRLTDSELEQRTYEEISIFYAVLWIQLQIITSGIALGSIVVMQNGRNAAHAKEHRVDEFELHRVIKWCEAHLASGKLSHSNATDDYMYENQLDSPEHSIMFDWSNLVYIAAATKSLCTLQQTSHSSSSDLLSVAQPDVLMNNSSDAASQPFEVVSLAHMRDVLRHEFHIRSDFAACQILLHMNHLGFFERLDRSLSLFDDDNTHDVYCIFPLPFGLDLSTNVEILVSAVEGCLADLDLSVNEVGFLLLLRRLWPNGLASDYALRRLARHIVSWILAEDDNLATILRDYLAKQKILPGVRPGHESPSWPSTQILRPTPSSSVNNGGDYVAARRVLLTQFAAPWLLALHDQDTAAYALLIYDICSEIDGSSLANETFSVQSDGKTERLADKCDKVLRSIIKLSQTSITFSIFEDLFVIWLESISAHNTVKEPIPSLSRLFLRENEVSHHISTISSPSSASAEGTALTTIDPWRVVIRIASGNKEGLSRSLQWLYMFARSGVEIPLTIFMRFSTLADGYNSSLADSLLLVKAVMSSAWLKSIGRQELQKVFAELHSRLSPHFIHSLKNGKDVTDNMCFIRQSLGTCLLLYGCDRSKVMELGMIKEEDIRDLPSRRKTNVRSPMVVDPMIIDPRLMHAIERYVSSDLEDVSCLVAKFLNTFLMDSPYLETYEVDNFILRNGRLLATCAWQFYGIQNHEISSIRTSFLLRTLVVDSQPFQDVLHDCFLPSVSWEQRLLVMTRLFRIILDVTSPSFGVDGRQWRSSITEIFHRFFNAMWGDEREEIRVAVTTFASTLLPAHFDAISLCWSESLAIAPIAERVKLISFLMQLRPHFPSWKALSWDAIVETLLGYEYDQKDSRGEDSPAPAHLSLNGSPSEPDTSNRRTNADPDMSLLRISILLLSLQMIADGIAIDSLTLLKIKVHLVRVIGFSDILVLPSQGGQSFHIRFGDVSEISELAFPCVNEMLSVLDAYYPIDLAPSAMAGADEDDDRPSSLLVGSVFVDVSLAMFCTVKDLSSLPILTFKSLLETLCVIIYKHDFESRTLKHLQQTLRRAVLRALDILSQDTSYEMRQLALSVVQAFIQRWHSFMGSIIYTAIESVAKLVASQHHHGQDALTSQAKLFIDTALTKYSQNGLFTNLLKRQLDPEFFAVLKQITEASARNSPASSESLRDTLLRDTLARAADSDPSTFQIVLNNIQIYVEVVFHQGYSAGLMLFVGQQLTYLARRTSEWAPDSIDPSPLLFIPAMLIQYNKTNSREMLSYIDTVMRVVLNRLNVSAKCLSRLLQVTASLYRRTQFNESGLSANGIVSLLFEILADGLRMKSRVLPLTLGSMLDAIMTTEIPDSLPPVISHLPFLLGLIDPGLHFLQNHIWFDGGKDFTASLAVGKMILQVAGQDPSVMNKLSDHSVEKAAHTNLGVRAWNILVLSALLEPTENWFIMLFAQLSTFSYAHHAALRIFTQSATSLPESSTTDINHAYIAIKLWVMLAQRVSESGAGDRKAFAVWNELWPPFESLVNIFEVEARAGLSLTLTTLISSSVADLFVFLRTLNTPIGLHTSTHVATLNRLRYLGLGETSTVKLTRALRSMSEPSLEATFEVLVNQAANEIVAAEKLKAIETRVIQERRGVPERHRRDARATT